MKRIMFIGLMVFLFQTFAYADEAQAPATQIPTTQQIIGQTDAIIAPAYFPTFEQFKNSTDTTCQKYLESTLSGARLDTVSPHGNKTTRAFSDAFVLINGLQLNYKIPEAYRTSAKLMVTWSVRVEGTATELSINPELCTSWYGTVTENFKPSLVETKLYVNGEAKGQQVTMEIPGTTLSVTETPPPPSPSGGGGGGGGGGGYVSHAAFFHQAMVSFRAFDPTLVGTYVLTAQDFGGTFPETVNIEIRWVNKTGMEIKSPTGMRSIIVNFLPVTKNE